MALINCYRENQNQNQRMEQNELEECKYQIKSSFKSIHHFHLVRRRNIERLERQSRISSDSEADTRGKFFEIKNFK